MRRDARHKRKWFSINLFLILQGVLMLMSGVHTGLVVLMNMQDMTELWQIIIPMVYWTLIALGLTIYTEQRIRHTYEKPINRMAEATSRVANGDFSVYVPPRHTPDKLDYLDVMFMDFNKMVEALGSVETLKTDFFSNVSHEIKTPLAVIQNNAELMRSDSLSQEQRQECAEAILQASKRLNGLITNMLKLNKLEKQVIAPMPDSYDVCGQLCACALQFEDQWEKKGIEFDAELEDRAAVYADEGLMELVWTNLLSNAIKFTPAGGSVTLRQRTDGECVVVTVSDTGCGMDRETQRHIFDKFYQGDTSHATEGNGLGLALVRRILQLSEGEIAVSSALGEGSSFTVTLPAAPRKREE